MYKLKLIKTSHNKYRYLLASNNKTALSLDHQSWNNHPEIHQPISAYNPQHRIIPVTLPSFPVLPGAPVMPLEERPVNLIGESLSILPFNNWTGHAPDIRVIR